MDMNDFAFYVYNRWGEIVFETTDIYDGWDGDYKGGLSPEDVYVYVVVIKDSLGQEKTFRGYVSLIMYNL